MGILYSKVVIRIILFLNLKDKKVFNIPLITPLIYKHGGNAAQRERISTTVNGILVGLLRFIQNSGF